MVGGLRQNGDQGWVILTMSTAWQPQKKLTSYYRATDLELECDFWEDIKFGASSTERVSCWCVRLNANPDLGVPHRALSSWHILRLPSMSQHVAHNTRFRDSWE